MTRLSRQTKRWQAINWLLTGAICLGPAHTTLAQPVYKVTDADGNVFTDTPPLSMAKLRSTPEQYGQTHRDDPSPRRTF